MRRRDLASDNPRLFGNSREEAIAKRGGYRRVPGSGSSNEKQDFRRGDFRVELKATRHASFRVDAEIMAKLANDGLTAKGPGVLLVEIGTGEVFAVMALSTFEELVPDGDQV